MGASTVVMEALTEAWVGASEEASMEASMKVRKALAKGSVRVFPWNFGEAAAEVVELPTEVIEALIEADYTI